MPDVGASNRNYQPVKKYTPAKVTSAAPVRTSTKTSTPVSRGGPGKVVGAPAAQPVKPIIGMGDLRRYEGTGFVPPVRINRPLLKGDAALRLAGSNSFLPPDDRIPIAPNTNPVIPPQTLLQVLRSGVNNANADIENASRQYGQELGELEPTIPGSNPSPIWEWFLNQLRRGVNLIDW